MLFTTSGTGAGQEIGFSEFSLSPAIGIGFTSKPPPFRTTRRNLLIR